MEEVIILNFSSLAKLDFDFVLSGFMSNTHY